MSDVTNYVASTTGIDFHKSNAFVKGIRGPYGSGKSVICCFELFKRMTEQTPSSDGVRRTRWIIVRNTFGELENTTMATWKDWFPERVFGAISKKPPYKQYIKFNDVEAEIIFLALDKPEDQKKLLSFEVTGIWFNEARQIAFELMRAALGRVGRYPPKKYKPDDVSSDNWVTWCGIIMDTNPPDDEHWYYKCAEGNEWAVDDDGNELDISTIEESKRWDFFAQPSGLSKYAENLEHLPGGRDYYRKMMIGNNSKDWSNVHVHGEYGYIKDGSPVYEMEWNSKLMVSSKIKIIPHGIIYVGIDASGRHPATVFAQKTSFGQWQILREFCVTNKEGMGAVSYAKTLAQYMKETFPDRDFKIWGDPAGGFKQQTDDRTYFDILKAEGIYIVPAKEALRIKPRLETVKSVLSRMVNGQPGIIIDESCKQLIRGMNGGYCYGRISTTGDAEGRLSDSPIKNRYSDVQDALTYVLSGAGETKTMLGKRNNFNGKAFMAKTEWDIY